MAVPAPVAASSTLTPALFRKLHPRPYLEKFLAEKVRPDGRTLDSSSAFRDASLNQGSISTAPASTLVRLGSTTVVCGITLEIAPPLITAPFQGFLVPNIDLPPLCSSLFRSGPPSDEAQVLSNRLRDILLASDVLPLDSLLIEPGKAAFVVYLDVVCLNFDGGVLDAAVLACIGALRTLKLPEANWDPDTEKTICQPISDLAPGKSIPLGPLPLSVSFGLFNDYLLPDPTLFESDLCTSSITIALTASPSRAKSSETNLVNVYQAGASSTNFRAQLKECIALAQARAAELLSLLDSA